MTEFCHICPTAFLDEFAVDRPHHLTLAHLVEKDPKYVEFYKNAGGINIMDNSAFEMYKEGREMFSAGKLVPLAESIGADYIVMTDYPGEAGIKTIEKAKEMAPMIKECGFGTFFVPQSAVGDKADLIEGFKWALKDPLIDYIGVSILAIPNAYGVESGNKLQRFLSRWMFMKELENLGLTEDMFSKKIHFLGMVDGPNEITLMKDAGFLKYIDTWDSSAATWAGLNGISFDHSPSGLMAGKYENPVDFDFPMSDNLNIQLAKENCEYIDKLLREF